MKDYSLGKIYRLVCNETGLQYVGHTTEKYLSNRKAKHTGHYKAWISGDENHAYYTAMEVMKSGNYSIVLIENYPCKSENELAGCERYWIENLECVNKVIPTRTKHEYYEEHKDAIVSRSKAYHENNRAVRLEQMKAYRDDHKQEKKESDKNYRQQRVTCECGSEISKAHTADHRKTKKHQGFLASSSSPL